MAIGTFKQAHTRLLDWVIPYWTRGEAGRETPAELFQVLYLGWLAAFVLKVLGSSWDVSWHFRWLRDDLAPPHLLNTAGTAIAVGLALVHWYTGYGVDRTASRLIQWGTGIFLIAIPLDLINHRVNGLDITAWSPSHALLFIGTALMIAGVIRGWFLGPLPGHPGEGPQLGGSGDSAGLEGAADGARPGRASLPARLRGLATGAPTGRQRTLVLGGLFVFFLENVHFPAQHQEYGVLELASWDRGQPYAEADLLMFAADQMGRAVDRSMVLKFSLPVPDYVYPVYVGVAGLIILVFARLMLGKRWTATAVAGVYVAYRCLVWPLLVGGGFPPSAVPFFLVAAAIGIDLAFFVRMSYLRPVVGALLATAGVYGGLAVQDRLLEAPPYALWSWPVTAAGLAMAWFGVEWFIRRYHLSDADSPTRPVETRPDHAPGVPDLGFEH